MQEDSILASQTVEEALYFAARLQLECSEKQIKENVDELLKTLRLDHVRHVYIGNKMLKGISGGEKRRVAVAMELITRPAVLFLDEPTSGLDSYSSMILIE